MLEGAPQPLRPVARLDHDVESRRARRRSSSRRCGRRRRCCRTRYEIRLNEPEYDAIAAKGWSEGLNLAGRGASGGSADRVDRSQGGLARADRCGFPGRSRALLRRQGRRDRRTSDSSLLGRLELSLIPAACSPARWSVLLAYPRLFIVAVRGWAPITAAATRKFPTFRRSPTPMRGSRRTSRRLLRWLVSAGAGQEEGPRASRRQPMVRNVLPLLTGAKVVCGDQQLVGNTTINNTTLVIENGQLDTKGYTLTGSGLTVVYQRVPTGGGTLNIAAPTSGAWSGVAIYQNPSLTTNVSFTYSGNSPDLGPHRPRVPASLERHLQRRRQQVEHGAELLHNGGRQHHGQRHRVDFRQRHAMPGRGPYTRHSAGRGGCVN